MAGSHSPASDPVDLECQQLRSQLAKSQQDYWELKEKFLIAEATNFALAKELKKYNCEKFKNIIESILTKKFHIEEPLAEKPTVPELLRKSPWLCFWESSHQLALVLYQDQELSQLRPKVQRGRNLAHILQQYLKDVLTLHDPETCKGQGFRRLLTEAVRLSACLEDLLGAENIEEEETPAQGPVADRELLEVNEMETPQSSQQETSITGAVDHLPSDSCLTEGTVQMSPDAEDTHGVLGVDGEHACSQKKEEPVTILPEKENDNDEVQEEAQALPHTSLIREIPEIEDQDVSQDSHELSLVAAPERKTRSQLKGAPHKDPITSTCESQSISPSDVPSSPKENVIKGKWKPRKWELACQFPGLEKKGKPQPTERKIACQFPGLKKGKPQTNISQIQLEGQNSIANCNIPTSSKHLTQELRFNSNQNTKNTISTP
ncbi:putative neuroblastoma breakpoint family member 5 [Lepus europaeus]|uniref:putative neuroblastoma breakpoint family member 5 n=1 Tax=Lepus europaeus TaxID=9983 RepID=UPI002B46A34E|nr:putative neuroblastoma breakpoint family member 5 [Lepus europaeus]